LRNWIKALAGLVAGGALFFLFILYSPLMREQKLEWVIDQLPKYADRIAVMGKEGYLIWTSHVWASAFVTFFGSLALGVASEKTPSRKRASYFTLSLPISRTRLVSTRIAAGLGATCAANLLLLMLDAIMTILTGHRVPWTDLLLTTAGATLSALALISTFQLTRWIPTWRGVGTLLGFLAILPIFWLPSHMDQLAVWGSPVLLMGLWGLVATGLTAVLAEKGDV
jgi:hypothetical protein